MLPRENNEHVMYVDAPDVEGCWRMLKEDEDDEGGACEGLGLDLAKAPSPDEVAATAATAEATWQADKNPCAQIKILFDS